MKPLFVLFSLLFASSVAFSQVAPPDQHQPQQGEQGWVQINSPTTTTIDWLVTQPNGTIWISDDNNTYRSKDLGETWWKHEALGLVLPAFFNDLEGVAGTPNGNALITVDGGETWQVSNPTELSASVPFVVQPHFVFAVDGDGGISKSTDKGRTWYKRQVDGFMYPIHFCDTLNGFTVGDAPSSTYGLGYRTTTGGEVWNKMKLPPHNYDAVFLLSTDTVFIASLAGHLLRSTNQGSSWEEKLFTESGNGITAINFINDHEGYVVGGRGRIYYSSNRGESWTQQVAPTLEHLYQIKFVDDSLGFVTGEHGLVLRTFNKGKSWVQILPRTLSLVVRVELRDGGVHLEYSLGAADDLTVAIYSPSGQLIKEALHNIREAAGPHTVDIDARNWASGTYLYRLEGRLHNATGKFNIIR